MSGALSASGRYVLSAEIEDITQPLFGVDMQVGLTVRYRLQDRAGKARWERRIVTRHRAAGRGLPRVRAAAPCQ
ncbi:hypothetical protein JMM63_17130 [Rhodovulum sulfidophilum]|uniref:hypothetical protein n=1 Tax=Rhodovulum sulfidophilum TaxID=35806 RepID=UPI001921C64B|nr:hypothetical protein [Rhodovulum sulfidophilum]MBL3597269.1 hypothetical protein [Rhodovulum sulfidophilum]